MLLRPLLLLCLSLASAAALAEDPYTFAQTPGKLPKDVVPLDYTVHLVPDLEHLTFRGDVRIGIRVLQATKRIVLNAHELEIDSATLAGGPTSRRTTSPRTLRPQLDAPQQTLAFALDRPLAPGRYQLAIAYRGVLQREPQGLYYDSYASPNGERRLLGTQFEPTDARRMLPAWDEPAFRAVFRLSVDVPARFSAFSNMPVSGAAPLTGGSKRVRFGPTPRMSSYLLAFVAGDLERTAARTGGVEVGIVTTEGKLPTAAYALAESRRVLSYYNDYFGIRYPLPKLDHIATPGGFGGAMENWGAITYNEARLLFDPALQSESARTGITSIVAHEMAHQWFGDLVTMAWWDNLWLNEGFASWMSTKASDALHPEWHAWLEATDEREWAMALDARRSTHPIQQPITDESEAGYAFDSITYGKGMSFLRMLEAYLGEAPFRSGIRAYLRQHRYSNTTTADLWAALAAATGKPVAQVASDWTLQPGFPLVSVDAACDAGQRRVTLRQQPFQSDAAGGGSVADRIWRVPVALADGVEAAGTQGDAAGTQGHARATQGHAPGTQGHAPVTQGDAAVTLLETPSAETLLPGCGGVLVADPDGVGFYRVQYAPKLFAALRDAMPRLPDATRVKLLADTAALARAGQLPLGDYTGLVERLGAEPRFAAWDRVLGDIRAVDQLLAGEPARADWRTWAIAQLRPRYDALGWDDRPGELDDARRLRGPLAISLAQLGDADVVADARARFHRFLAEPQSLAAAQAERVVRIAGLYADAADHAALERLATAAMGTTEKERYYGALEAAVDPALAAETMQLALRTDLPPYVTNRALERIAAAGHADATWAFSVAHADELLKLRRDPWLQSATFSAVAARSTRAALADEMLAFTRERLLPATLAEAERDADVLRERAAVKARLAPQIAAAVRTAR